jgi:two-component system, OmpR family, KDP operon response regulator KdpE
VQVRRDGDDLTPIEFKRLKVLIHRRGRLLIHNSLLQQVWVPAYTGTHQTPRVHIANLRRKIEPADGRRHSQ